MLIPGSLSNYPTLKNVPKCPYLKDINSFFPQLYFRTQKECCVNVQHTSDMKCYSPTVLPKWKTRWSVYLRYLNSFPLFNSRLDALSSKQYHVIQKADWVIYVMQLWTSILFKVLSACFTALTLLECPQGCWILGTGEQKVIVTGKWEKTYQIQTSIYTEKWQQWKTFSCAFISL